MIKNPFFIFKGGVSDLSEYSLSSVVLNLKLHTNTNHPFSLPSKSPPDNTFNSDVQFLHYFCNTHTHLQGPDGSTLEAQIRFEVLSDLPHQTLEG